MRFNPRFLLFVIIVLSEAIFQVGCTGGGSRTNAVLTRSNDVARTGQYLNESILNLGNVNSTQFGKVGFLPTGGLVLAQPLYVPNLKISGKTRNVAFVATVSDLLYAFDADTFEQLWQVSLLGPNETPSDNHSCSALSPEIGITSTPVIDLDAGPNGTIFLVASSKDSDGNHYHRLHALDLVTGEEQSGGPTTIQGTFPNLTGSVTFDPAQYFVRSGLLLLDGRIYVAWASYCDFLPYTGWVMGYDESSLQQVSILNLTPNGSYGGVWMSGAGLAADASGNIYLIDGNGTFDTVLDAEGFPINGNYGNAFVKLSTTGGSLQVADYFAPYNTVEQSAVDLDFGSGGAMLLPDMKDEGGTAWQLAIGAGKDQNIYVVDRNSMGKFSPAGNNIYQEIDGALGDGHYGGVYAKPAYFNGMVYFVGRGDTLKAYSISNAKLSSNPASQSSLVYTYPGATPAVSANGSLNGIVWAVERVPGVSGVLHAYDARGLGNELYNSNQAAGDRDKFSYSKYAEPIIADGKVYIQTSTGVVVFGLLP